MLSPRSITQLNATKYICMNSTAEMFDPYHLHITLITASLQSQLLLTRLPLLG